MNMYFIVDKEGNLENTYHFHLLGIRGRADVEFYNTRQAARDRVSSMIAEKVNSCNKSLQRLYADNKELRELVRKRKDIMSSLMKLSYGRQVRFQRDKIRDHEKYIRVNETFIKMYKDKLQQLSASPYRVVRATGFEKV